MYNFPVELQPLRLPNGSVVPKVKAVVRTDTVQTLAVVSDRYKLVPYELLVEAAESFVKLFGEPERTFHLDKDGRKMAAQFTYRDRTEEIAVDDLVGLRIWIENSYNKNTSVRFRIGALRLKCLNGAMASTVVFETTIRHTAKSLEQGIQFPTQEEVLAGFKKATRFWKELATSKITVKNAQRLTESAIEQGLIPPSASDYDDGEPHDTAWGLYNNFTHYVNHKSKASPLGKIRRLDRIDRFFVRAFS